jgi:hypothetical protein
MELEDIKNPLATAITRRIADGIDTEIRYIYIDYLKLPQSVFPTL